MESFIQILVFVSIVIAEVQGLKCYLCIYWDGPGVPSDHAINDITCKKGHIPHSRFAQECDPGNICAFAHIDATSDQSIKSLSVRSCLPTDRKLKEKCVRLKTLRHLYQLEPVSRIINYENEGVISDGYECGCTTDLCNKSSTLPSSKWKIITLLFIWIFFKFLMIFNTSLM